MQNLGVNFETNSSTSDKGSVKTQLDEPLKLQYLQ